MTTQNGVTLESETLEMISLTAAELSKVTKPVNGNLYHTTDTNQFYFDWGNRRYNLSVFTSNEDSSTEDFVKKTELTTWLDEHNYLTSLSLADEIADIIGKPVSEIITLNALEDYGNEHFLTREEIGQLSEPIQILQDIQELKDKDESLYTVCNTLANKIDELRTITNEKLTQEDLDKTLQDYVTKEIADATYLSIAEAKNKYIDTNKLTEKLKTYITKDSLSSTLNDYAKKSEYVSLSNLVKDYYSKSQVQKILVDYIKSSDVQSTYLSKTDADSKYTTTSYVDNKLGNYMKTSEIKNTFATKSDMSSYATTNSLVNYAKKVWIDQFFATKTSLNDYLTKSEASSTYLTDKTAGNIYITKEDANTNYISKETAENEFITDSTLTKKLGEYINSEKISESYAKKVWIDQYFATKTSLNDYLSKTEAGNTYLTNNTASKKYLSKEEAETNYISKETAKNDFITEQTLTDRLKNYNTIDKNEEAFAKKIWVDQYYMRRKDMTDYLSKEEAKEGYLSITDAVKKYLNKSDAKDIYLSKAAAEETYVNNEKLSALLNQYLTNTKAEEAFAKKIWVDQYYMRKGEIKGIENAMVLSNEYDTYAELKEVKDDVREGFYYLNTDKNIVVVVDDKNGNRMILNLQGSPIQSINSVIVNGKKYGQNEDGDIELPNVVSNIEGETEISEGNIDYVSVTSKNSIEDGVNTISLTSSVKTYDIATSTDTENGLATAKNVKDYVEENINAIDFKLYFGGDEDVDW